VLRAATAVFATSASSRRALAAAGELDEAEIGILPVPVELDRFTPLPESEWRAEVARPTLVFAGRGDDPRKNVGLLLDAFARVREQRPDVRLRFVGRPPAGPHPEGATVLGHVPSLAESLRDAALFVLPSLQEGFGIVAAEALAAGVPVVTTPSGGPEDLVRESGGGLVLSGFSSEELAATVVTLLDDPETLVAMRSRGRTYVEREHSPARFRSLLEAALAGLDAA
jgi:phosphatidylinositol alpha-mannosyltransferase